MEARQRAVVMLLATWACLASPAAAQVPASSGSSGELLVADTRRKVTDMVSQLVRLALEDGRRENGSRHSGPQAKGASAPLKNLVPVK